MTYRFNSRKRHFGLPNRIWLILFILITAIVLGTFWARHLYNLDLQPVSKSQITTVITIEKGSSVKQIAAKLQASHLIKSSWAFELYVHSHQATSQLLAGTYALAPNQSLQDIVTIISKGLVTTNLVTVLPGVTINKVRADFINSGFSPPSVDNALNPDLYSSMPVMAFKPTGVNTLEGLLWPDSFEKDPTTDPSVIIKESLNEMSSHLTPDVQSAFASVGLNVYQGLTLSSIIIKEVNKPNDQSQVAQVFLSRLKSGMVLGSDVTAIYGSTLAGQAPKLSYDTPYNTLINHGLPPTPISTINSSSLYAASHPANTNWLYFVSGDDGNTYFSVTANDHQNQVNQYCHKLCSQ